VADEATRCGMPFVTERWMGGMLTNWSTMYQRIQELERLEKLRETDEISRLTKKEGLLIERQIIRLQTRLSGARTMKRRPELLFVVDACREEAAVHEANLLGIPIVALVDTNCNPQVIDYVIPSNDDAIRAIKLLVAQVADAVLEGAAARKEEEAEAVPAEEAQASVAPRPSRAPAVEAEKDEDIGEEALLGESTMAKLKVTRKVPGAEEAPAETVKEVKKEEAETESATKAAASKTMAEAAVAAPEENKGTEAGTESAADKGL